MRLTLILLLLINNFCFAQDNSENISKLSNEKARQIAESYMDKGYIRIGLGDIDGAAKNWEKAMEYYPPYKVFYFIIADYYSRAGNINKACSYFLKTDKHHDQARMELGICEIRKKNWVKAISYFQQSLDLLPNQALAYYYIATCYGVLKKHKLAQSNLDRALSINPSLSIDSENVLYKYKYKK